MLHHDLLMVTVGGFTVTGPYVQGVMEKQTNKTIEHNYELNLINVDSIHSYFILMNCSRFNQLYPYLMK